MNNKNDTPEVKHQSIFIWLRSKIETFDIQDEVAAWLSRDFPHVEIVLCEEFEEIKELISDADVLLTWYFEKPWFDQAPKLKWIFTPAAGKDWVPLDPLGRVDVHYGSFHGPMMVESLLAMMFHHNRAIPQLMTNQFQKKWDRNAQKETQSLQNKKIQIWGYGAIGDRCAHVLQAFGCEVFGVCRTPSTKSNRHHVTLQTPGEAKSQLNQMDMIISFLPTSDEIVMDVEFFHSLKNGVQFYSLGRGNSIDESALLNVLNTGLVSFAGMDVFQEEPLSEKSPLWEHPSVLISPHSSCVMRDYGRMFYTEAKIYLDSIFAKL